MSDIAYLEEQARGGDTGAMWSVAEAYLCGWGVEKDPVKAQEWHEKRIPILLGRAENNNDRKAMADLEVAYLYGLGVKKDPDKAKEWHKKYWGKR